MEPQELNFGRYYLRPLHDDDRINDIPALAEIFPSLGSSELNSYVADQRQMWLADTGYSFAVCEQTSVELVALALVRREGNLASLRVYPRGELSRLLPNDPMLEQQTVADAVRAAKSGLPRWIEGALGLQLSDQA